MDKMDKKNNTNKSDMIPTINNKELVPFSALLLLSYTMSQTMSIIKEKIYDVIVVGDSIFSEFICLGILSVNPNVKIARIKNKKETVKHTIIDVWGKKYFLPLHGIPLSLCERKLDTKYDKEDIEEINKFLDDDISKTYQICHEFMKKFVKDDKIDMNEIDKALSNIPVFDSNKYLPIRGIEKIKMSDSNYSLLSDMKFLYSRQIFNGDVYNIPDSNIMCKSNGSLIKLNNKNDKLSVDNCDNEYMINLDALSFHLETPLKIENEDKSYTIHPFSLPITKSTLISTYIVSNLIYSNKKL